MFILFLVTNLILVIIFKFQITAIPYYGLNNSGTNFDGTYFPDNCIDGRFRLRQKSSNGIIRYRKNYGWIAYRAVSKIFHADIFDITQSFVWRRRVNLLLNRLRYSDDVSGCNPKTVSHCPRISGFIQNDSVNPPETQRWKFSKNSLPDISTLGMSETLIVFISNFIYKRLYEILFLIDVISF